MIQVYMLKDVENVGMTGQIVKVSEGYASNFLLPKKLATRVDETNKKFYEGKQVREKITQEVLSTKAAMLAERIKSLHLTIKQKVHDDGKLYGALSADIIVDLLKDKEISITKKQVEFTKNIKNIGEHKVVIKLSAKLKPELTLKVVGDASKH
ncbi:50S ribosomal protein L9 [Candidatus Dependentiae bacterium]|nr:50S ribosomal protein L9 [Candidatus Dependentiae bacterium]